MENAMRETPTPTIKDFEFTGRAGEYFSIWIVNILLTILTLGIYSAWAKVRNKQYFYGNTHLDGNSFRYLAEPKQILKGRVIAAALFAVYYFSGLISPVATLITLGIIMLFMPAFVVMSMSFQARNSAYRNIRFNFDKNFRRSYLIFSFPVLLIGAYVGMTALYQSELLAAQQTGESDTGLLILFSLFPLLIMLLSPWWEYLLTSFKINHADFGTADFNFSASTRDYYKLYLKMFLVLMLAVIGYGIFSSIIAGIAGAISSSNTEPADRTPEVYMLIGFLFVLPLYFWMFAYMQTKKTNLIYGNITVDGHQLQSALKVWYMLYLYITNTIAIALSLGLLIPWARIRTARYRASVTSVQTDGDFDHFIAAQIENQSALGEEMGEVFDMDLGM